MSRTPRTTSASALRSVVIAALVAASFAVFGPGEVARANPTGTGLVISQVYGGGGNSGAPLNQDFVEIFNPTDSPMLLDGLSVQYASSAGTGNFGSSSTQLTPLSGSLGPGQYLLVAEASGATGNGLPTPDITDATPISMSASAGKVIIADTAASLGCNGSSAPCNAAQQALIIDLVGYGTANFLEGAAPAPGLDSMTAALRADGGCTDSDDNGADFVAAAPSPRNTDSPSNPCSGGGSPPIALDCSAPFVTDAGVAASTAITARDADDQIVSMALIDDDVAPGGNLTEGAFTPSAGVGDTATLELDLDAVTAVGIYSATVQAENAAGDTTTCVLQVQVSGVTAIHDVQGSGSASPVVGATVTIEGIVVGDFQDGSAGTNGDLNGFHVQEEDADADSDTSTSEGIFVFNGNAPAVDVKVGDLVRVSGPVSEFNGLTEITSFSGVTVISSGNPLPAPTVLSLPVPTVDAFEPVEGMYVTFPQDLVISEYFNFDQFGELVLTSRRHLTPTAEFEPGPAAVEAAAEFVLDRITLDDGRSTQNPDPAIHPDGAVFDLGNRFRGGDTVANVTGVMDYGFGLYRIQPTQGADYVSTNPRTAAPDPVGGDITVSSFNVLNYFTTLDNGVDDICGPAQNQECRGADDVDELERQRAKIVAAMTAIDADVFGLLEIENNVDDEAVTDLVAALNAATGAGTYAAISTGTIGTDAIKVAMIYQPATVTPIGSYAILDSTVDPRFIDTKSRPALAQTFADNATGGLVTIAINHLKSKGSACDDVGDPDTGDGSGNCNATRTAAAEALVDWLATDPTGSGDADFLIMGDLNSYDKEAPIRAIVAGSDDQVGTGDDYTDLLFRDLGEDAYSYVFDGQTGYLDQALANAELADQVSAVTVWHINSDEPDLLDYDTSFKLPAQQAIYAPDPYRSSDHDPVIIGLDLTGAETARSMKEAAREELIAALPTGTRATDVRLRTAIALIDTSLAPQLWTGDSTLDGNLGGVVFISEGLAVNVLQAVDLPVARDVIDQLLQADLELATVQIGIATDAGGRSDWITRAQTVLDKALEDVTDGQYARAINDYRLAWRWAFLATP